jgi:pyruvate-formate lyase-activating enzyme
MFSLVFANEKGELFDYPGLAQAGRLGDQWVEPLEEELIPLPEGATLTMIPGRFPVGINPASGRFEVMSANPYSKGELAWAVGALLPQGYTRTLLPGFARTREARPLPLLGYTAVGFKAGRFYVAALPTDEDNRWNPRHYNTEDLEARVDSMLAAFPGNRILKQLAKCSLEYGCFTAQNIFYGRWEGGIPSSPACNAQCLGCISLQPSECCPSPQNRIEFVPSAEEIVEIGLAHLQDDEAIISFGQGCEGEPALQAKLLAEAVRRIRAKTAAGTININTNAGFKSGIIQLVEAGLDAMRVSIISPTPEIYNSYYRPRNYSIDDVRYSLKFAADKGVYTSLNLLAFPGVTDREEEIEAVIELTEDTGVKLIQIRNLNIDPDYFLEAIPGPKGEVLGLPAFLEILASELPGVRIGNYSKPAPRKRR